MMEGCLKGFFIVIAMFGVQWFLFKKVIGWPEEKAIGFAVASSLAMGFFYRLYSYCGFNDYLFDIITIAVIFYGYIIAVRSLRAVNEERDAGE